MVTIKLFLNAKCSLFLWSKWQIGHRKWFLNTNLFLSNRSLLPSWTVHLTFRFDKKISPSQNIWTLICWAAHMPHLFWLYVIIIFRRKLCLELHESWIRKITGLHTKASSKSMEPPRIQRKKHFYYFRVQKLRSYFWTNIEQYILLTK